MFCGEGESCLFTPTNPNAGASGFDNIFDALAAVFQAVSLEGWSELLHQLAVPQPILSPLYFICLIVFGAFFVMNLYVVVMSESYLRTRESLPLSPLDALLDEPDFLPDRRLFLPDDLTKRSI